MCKSSDRNVDIAFEMAWTSRDATHKEQYLARSVDIDSDSLPLDLTRSLEDSGMGETVHICYPAGQAVPASNPELVLRLDRKRFTNPAGYPVEPRRGRFYPLEMLPGLHGHQSSGLKAFRISELENGRLIADLNHPLADARLVLSATLKEASEARVQDSPRDVSAEVLDSGPGMQARGCTRTDFGKPPLRRKDETEDSKFYERPRFVDHIDSRASSLLTDEYSRYLKPGMNILDLMAGSKSHLPAGSSAFGLGLNAEEMQVNPDLHGYEIQNLNREFELRSSDNSFDAAVCSLSVEYLIDPWAVTNDAARVLKPGAPLLFGFSNRWFPTKAAGFWPEMHEFERMGFVLDLFLESGEFEELRTVSYRGRPRPADDPYAGRMAHSDPVYVVSGKKRAC